jgi:hypothetical protein
MAREDIRLRVGLAALFVLLVACNGGESGGNPDPAGASSQSMRHGLTLTDLQIAELLYAGTQRTPAGFVSDAPPPGMGVVSTHHLQNTHLAIAADRHELCTDDWNQALNWSNATAGETELLVGNSTTDHYFEFQRMRDGVPVVTTRVRVFRCAYLDRSAVDLADVQGPAGLLNLRPIDAGALRNLSEYLWQFSPYNNADHAVLLSRGASMATGLEHEVVQARLERSGHGGCDRVTVAAWRHKVAFATGALVREWVPLWEFGARREVGGVATC